MVGLLGGAGAGRAGSSARRGRGLPKKQKVEPCTPGMIAMARWSGKRLKDVHPLKEFAIMETKSCDGVIGYHDDPG